MGGALIVRVVAALTFWHPGAIGGEGAEYARIAQNLRDGFGYVGIATPGAELMFPPLFPALIGIASYLTGEYEWAGRLVGLIFGAALPLPVYGIARKLFGRTAGLNAAFITACHPLCINLSFSVLTEGPYATLMLSAVYLVLKALDDDSIVRHWIVVGIVFGLAYLVRQEALASFAIAISFGLVSSAGSWQARVKRCLA
jgi:4-amino-4-deoxy-L-arabinose transferase-like glycosyltransferase